MATGQNSGSRLGGSIFLKVRGACRTLWLTSGNGRDIGFLASPVRNFHRIINLFVRYQKDCQQYMTPSESLHEDKTREAFLMDIVGMSVTSQSAIWLLAVLQVYLFLFKICIF